jgi:uncharacterized protein (TIGR02452 family)
MALRFEAAVDSPDHAETRRRELDLPRDEAQALGLSALEAARTGRYITADGRTVDWQAAIRRAVAAKKSIPPDAPLPNPRPGRFAETRVVVTNETTMGAAARLTEAGGRPLSLNFANGVEPGGGFLRGARAQEEALCRSSALYLTLDGDPMYAAHRQDTPYESSDWAILSPDVPVFRRDDGTPLPEPWTTSFITSAAPYAPRVGQPRSADLMQRRIERLLAIAHAHNFDTLILGAWGCGAFANDPTRTARDFRTSLETTFESAFHQVTFAIADWSPDRRFLGPFRNVFRG